MSLFSIFGARGNRKAWIQALNAAGSKLDSKTTRDTLGRVTDQMVADDCRVIGECARDIIDSETGDGRRQKHLILYSRYSRLIRLEPYASRSQKKRIAEAKRIVTEARKYK